MTDSEVTKALSEVRAELQGLRDDMRSGFATLKERLSSLEIQQASMMKTLALQAQRDVLLQQEIDRHSERLDKVERPRAEVRHE